MFTRRLDFGGDAKYKESSHRDGRIANQVHLLHRSLFSFPSSLTHKVRQLAELGLFYRGSPAIIRTRGLRHCFLAQSEGLSKDNLLLATFQTAKRSSDLLCAALQKTPEIKNYKKSSSCRAWSFPATLPQLKADTPHLLGNIQGGKTKKKLSRLNFGQTLPNRPACRTNRAYLTVLQVFRGFRVRNFIRLKPVSGWPAADRRHNG
jgi:hypothetical protein